MQGTHGTSDPPPPFLPPTLTSLRTSHWPGSDPDEASHAGLKAESILKLIPSGRGHTPGSVDLFARRVSVNTPLGFGGYSLKPL